MRREEHAEHPRQAETVQHGLARRHRRAQRYLLAATVVLAGVAVHLIALGRVQIWSAAHRNLQSLAMGLETSATALLEQSSSSLSALRGDLPARPPSPSQTLETLQAVIRGDPDSAYLGVLGPTGLIAVDHQGRPVAADLKPYLSSLRAPQQSQIALGSLLRIPYEDEWYLPLTSPLPGDPSSFVFALVPLSRLLGGAHALDLVPDSRVTLVTDDGNRPLIYEPGAADRVIANGAAGTALMEHLAGKKSGSFEFSAPIDDAERVAAFSHSPVLPFYILVTVRTATLGVLWLQQSAAPAIILGLAICAVVIFALNLNAVAREQQRHTIHQEYRADHDTLTGLLNRDAFMRVLAHATDVGAAEPFVVLLLDLNRFKDINDTLGHAAGDRVLEKIGERLNGTIPAASHVARLGGDELGILAPGDFTAGRLEQLVAEVRRALEQPIALSGVGVDISASIGAALYPQDARNPIELLRCADIAMYAAKGDLRPFNRYSESLDHFAPEMLALHGELAKALREHSLAIAYQPKVRLSDGAIVGLEALARWTHPLIGLVPPAKFVHIAESTELIHPFTLYVLERVAEQIADWQARGCAIPIAVNVSANNLLDPGFVDKLAGVLRTSRIPGQLLELEVTEGALIRHIETILKRLQQIRALGVSLAIDDFGTGYASLAYLKRLPLQTLKIDRSFIFSLASDSADQRIVRSTIQLAHSFDIAVVAEGVESAAVAQRLRAEVCDFAQGYHFGRPQAASDIERQWLQPVTRLRSASGGR